MATAIAEPQEGVASFSAFVPVELKRSLIEAARANDRTLSAEVRIALREHLIGWRAISELVAADR